MTRANRATTPPSAAETAAEAPSRKPVIDVESMRAAAKASIRAGFPVPTQFVEGLGGDAGVEALEAEVKAEDEAAAAAAAAEMKKED